MERILNQTLKYGLEANFGERSLLQGLRLFLHYPVSVAKQLPFEPDHYARFCAALIVVSHVHRRIFVQYQNDKSCNKPNQ